MPKLAAPPKLTKKTQQDNWFGDCMISLSEEREGKAPEQRVNSMSGG